MAANASRYPVSAQCRVLGVPRATHHWMLAHPGARAGDLIAGDAAKTREEGFRECGARR